MFEYFPNNYSWNLGLLMALQLGGDLNEIHSACAGLVEVAARPNARNDPAAQQAWYEAWTRLGARLRQKAEHEHAAGHGLSAGRKYRRAAVYYMTAERMASHKSPDKMAAYRAMIDCFALGVKLREARVEWVDIPYERTTLPALFVPAASGGAAPCMIHFDGFDVHKEWTWLSGMPDEFARRGVASLIVDHPGVGAALRLRGLPTSHETERWASAALDYLETRPDVDRRRIGVTAMSLGGYYAPRAAAFEKRLACCVAWGARWDNAGSHGRILKDPNAARSVPGWVEHALWVYGQPDVESCAAAIARMTLDGVADKITCPLLVIHGANDRQVPVEQAERTVAAAINSPRRDLKVFTEDEGGAEHVQGDQFSLAIDYIADWVADVLLASPARRDK